MGMRSKTSQTMTTICRLPRMRQCRDSNQRLFPSFSTSCPTRTTVWLRLSLTSLNPATTRLSRTSQASIWDRECGQRNSRIFRLTFRSRDQSLWITTPLPSTSQETSWLGWDSKPTTVSTLLQTPETSTRICNLPRVKTPVKLSMCINPKTSLFWIKPT